MSQRKRPSTTRRRERAPHFLRKALAAAIMAAGVWAAQEAYAIPAVVELSSLNGANGFALNGITTGDQSGISVSGAGDVNGDGLADLIVGADYADPNGDRSGQSYVVFGVASAPPASGVPEPASGVLLGAALGLFGLFRRRRKHA